MTEQLLGRDAILDADDIELVPVKVPEWKGSVLVRPLSGTERDEYEASNLRERKNGTTRLNLRNARARLVQMCVVDADGRRLFSKADIDRLGRKSASALDRIAEVARDASGITEEQEREMVEGFDGAESEAPEPTAGALSSSASH